METKATPELTQNEKVQLLFKKLKNAQAEIANAERPTYITNGQFRYSESVGASIDLTSVRDERKLVEILAFLKERANSYAEAAAELKVNSAFTWLGFTVEEWSKDLITRVSILQLTNKRKELAELEKRVNAIVTPELRAQMEFEAISALLD